MKPMMVYSVLAMTALQSSAFALDNTCGAFNSQQVVRAESLFTKTSELMHTLRGHIPHIVKAMNDKGSVAGDQVLPVTIALQLNNEDELNAKIEAMYDPSSATFHQFLTPAEFVASYAPTAAQIVSEKAFLETHGIQVQDVSENNMFIHATGTVAALNAAFATEVHQYVSNKTGKEYFAPAYDVQTPVSSRITGVIGLSNTAVLHNHIAKPNAAAHTNPEGSAPNGGLAPADIRTAYGVPSTLTGKGQSLALFELDGFKAANIAAYEKQFKLTAPKLATVLVDGASATPTTGADSGELEVELDIELMVALAPSATAIYVYEGPNSSAGLIDTYAKIASDNLAKQISSSWGESESTAAASDMQSENKIFKQMVAQGQSLFSAAGDSGAEDDGSTVSVDDPSGQPYVVAVGGTKMTISSKAAWTAETTWNELTSQEGAGGGGVSTVWTIPSWQSGAATTDTQASKKMRNVPDVSLNADPETGYGVYVTIFDPDTNKSVTQFLPIGGTSAAAPLWAAFNALVNQNRVAKGLTTTGFLNPALYTAGKTTGNFHDIADNSNNGDSTGSFKAVKGYDNATGWGSFQATTLLNTLSVK